MSTSPETAALLANFGPGFIFLVAFLEASWWRVGSCVGDTPAGGRAGLSRPHPTEKVYTKECETAGYSPACDRRESPRGRCWGGAMLVCCAR